MSQIADELRVDLRGLPDQSQLMFLVLDLLHQGWRLTSGAGPKPRATRKNKAELISLANLNEGLGRDAHRREVEAKAKRRRGRGWLDMHGAGNAGGALDRELPARSLAPLRGLRMTPATASSAIAG